MGYIALVEPCSISFTSQTNSRVVLLSVCPQLLFQVWEQIDFVGVKKPQILAVSSSHQRWKTTSLLQLGAGFWVLNAVGMTVLFHFFFCWKMHVSRCLGWFQYPQWRQRSETAPLYENILLPEPTKIFLKSKLYNVKLSQQQWQMTGAKANTSPHKM